MRHYIEAVKSNGKVRFAELHSLGNSKTKFDAVSQMFPRCNVKIYELVDVTDNYRG